LPKARLIELVSWRDNYSIDQFVFLLGARRRGSIICVETQRGASR
jgi:hypothetical protein